MTKIETILSRAMNDVEFADLLFNEPDKALEAYDLSAVEIAQIKSLSHSRFEAIAVEERKSFSINIKQSVVADQVGQER